MKMVIEVILFILFKIKCVSHIDNGHNLTTDELRE